MTKPKKYGLRLVDAIKANISSFCKKKPGKNTYFKSYKETAKSVRLNQHTFTKCMNGTSKFSRDNLFTLISMPFVTEKEAQRLIFLWIADAMDSHKVPQRKIFDKKDPQYLDYGIPFLDDYRIPWTPDIQRKQLDRWAASLDKLANYSDTLGIIDQIDYARERQRKIIKNDGYIEDEYGVPVHGPKISSQKFDDLIKAHTTKAITRTRILERPIVDLALKFAKDLAAQEAKGRIEDVEGFLQDEMQVKMGDEIDNYYEKDREDNQDLHLKDLDIEISDHIETNKSVNNIMMQLKANSTKS